MARYTMLLGEYLQEGGTLPSNFSQISGFDDLFTGYYIDKEIGFETEYLFQVKLQTYADIYIPLYKDKLDNIATAIGKVITPSKTSTETRNLTNTKGSQTNSGSQGTTELPINATSAEENQVVETSSTEGQRIDLEGGTRAVVETGETQAEALAKVEFLNAKAQAIKLNLLKEFAPCFMGIYK